MQVIVVRDSRARRALAALVGAAGLVWALSWGFSGQLSDGSSAVLGLGEGEWRAALNPALAILLLGALAVLPARAPLRPARAAAAGFVLVGIALLLIGNVLQFGPLGVRVPTAAAGSASFVAGAALATLGIGLLAGASVPLRGRRPILRASIVTGATVVLGLTAVAVPAAAGMLATVVMDALLRSPEPLAGQAPFRATAAA